MCFVQSIQEWEVIWDEIAGQYAEEVSKVRLTEAIKSTDIGQKVSDELIASLLKSADTNQDGVIQKSEFMELVREMNKDFVRQRYDFSII